MPVNSKPVKTKAAPAAGAKAPAAKKAKTASKAKPVAKDVATTTTAKAAAVPAEVIVDDAASATTEVPSTVLEIKALQLELEAMSVKLKAAIAGLKRIEKKALAEDKKMQKIQKKRSKTASGDKRAPSGFAKPAKLSDELCSFLGVGAGTLMARTDVTKEVNQYIKSNKLQNPENKRHIVPDTKLAKLLKTKPADEVTYFNLQTYMRHHYTPASISASSASSSA